MSSLGLLLSGKTNEWLAGLLVGVVEACVHAAMIPLDAWPVYVRQRTVVLE